MSKKMPNTQIKNWYYTIKSEKQDNGLWGMPIQCEKIDAMPILSDGNEIKRSAIIIGIAECYPDETFEIFYSKNDRFIVKLSKSGMKKIVLDDYKLVGDTLVWNP